MCSSDLLYRVAKNGTTLIIRVPHRRHDNFLNDPTHVRAITPELFALFSKKKNREWKKQGCANSPLALYHDVDFNVVSVKFALEEPYLGDFKRGKLKPEDIDRLIRTINNVAHEIEIIAKAVK